jgi:hypothetical protein
MKIKPRFVKHSVMKDLRGKIRANLKKYQSGNFAELLEPANVNHLYFELGAGEIDLSAFSKLQPPQSGDLREAHNARVVFEALKGISQYQARDERLWVYLCHTVGLDHIRKRHKKILEKDPEKAAAEIEKTFFVTGGLRGFERNNALARLWSYGAIASRNKSVPINKTLEVFLYQTDVRAQIVERPTTFVNPSVFSAAMRFMDVQYRKKKTRDFFFNRKEGVEPVYRQLFAKVNEVGGVMLLGAMPPKELDRLFVELGKAVGI